MYKNLFPDSLFSLVKKIWQVPCAPPYMLAIENCSHCSDWDYHENPFKEWFTPQEREQLQEYRFAKRQKEWLAGRICTKLAVNDYFHTYHPDKKALLRGDIHIENLESGRPSLVNSIKGTHIIEPDISISHSQDYALALACKSSCGIDIQHCSEQLLRVKSRFCTDNEERLLRSLSEVKNTLMHLTFLWAAKEAIKKTMGNSKMPGFMDLQLVNAESHVAGFLFTFSHLKNDNIGHFKVVVGQFKNYGIGICIHDLQ